MRSFTALASFMTLLLASAAAPAQDRPTAPRPAASAPAQTMPMDCPAMKRHDRGAERNMPGPSSMMGCAPGAAASAAAPAKGKPRARPTHDHARFHKGQ